jgi:hypothetical protein
LKKSFPENKDAAKEIMVATGSVDIRGNRFGSAYTPKHLRYPKRDTGRALHQPFQDNRRPQLEQLGNYSRKTDTVAYRMEGLRLGRFHYISLKYQ